MSTDGPSARRIEPLRERLVGRAHPVDEVVRIEHASPRERTRHQERRERPLRRDERRDERRSYHGRKREGAELAVEPMDYEIDEERGDDDQWWKRQRHHVGEMLVDRTKLRRRRKELDRPHEQEHEGRE